MRLTILRSLVWASFAIFASTGLALAGPCSDEIAEVMQSINSILEQIASAGRTAREGTGLTQVQPTPRSIAAAEAQLGELSPEKIDAVRQAMARARAADLASDKAGCEEALANAKQALRP